MAAVTLVTVQKELFKNVAEILLEAQAARNLISERLVGEQKEEEESPQQFPGWGWDMAGSAERGILWGSVFLQAALGSSLLSSRRPGSPAVFGFGKGETGRCNE